MHKQFRNIFAALSTLLITSGCTNNNRDVQDVISKFERAIKSDQHKNKNAREKIDKAVNNIWQSNKGNLETYFSQSSNANPMVLQDLCTLMRLMYNDSLLSNQYRYAIAKDVLGMLSKNSHMINEGVLEDVCKALARALCQHGLEPKQQAEAVTELLNLIHKNKSKIKARALEHICTALASILNPDNETIPNRNNIVDNLLNLINENQAKLNKKSLSEICGALKNSTQAQTQNERTTSALLTLINNNKAKIDEAAFGHICGALAYVLYKDNAAIKNRDGSISKLLSIIKDNKARIGNCGSRELSLALMHALDQNNSKIANRNAIIEDILSLVGKCKVTTDDCQTLSFLCGALKNVLDPANALNVQARDKIIAGLLSVIKQLKIDDSLMLFRYFCTAFDDINEAFVNVLHKNNKGITGLEGIIEDILQIIKTKFKRFFDDVSMSEYTRNSLKCLCVAINRLSAANELSGISVTAKLRMINSVLSLLSGKNNALTENDKKNLQEVAKNIASLKTGNNEDMLAKIKDVLDSSTNSDKKSINK